MLDRTDAGVNRIFHPRCAMSMGGDFTTGLFGFIHGGAKFFQRHLCLIGGGAGCEDSSGGDHFYHFGTRLDLLPHDPADLFYPFSFLGDEPPQMSSDHANRKACSDDSRAWSEPFVDRCFQRKNRMVT